MLDEMPKPWVSIKYFLHFRAYFLIFKNCTFLWLFIEFTSISAALNCSPVLWEINAEWQLITTLLFFFNLREMFAKLFKAEQQCYEKSNAFWIFLFFISGNFLNISVSVLFNQPLIFSSFATSFPMWPIPFPLSSIEQQFLNYQHSPISIL